MTIRRIFTVLGRLAPLGLPAFAVGVVGFVALGAGRAQSVVGARMRGGPTEGAHVLTFRLEVVTRHDDSETPVASRVVSVVGQLANGEALKWRGVLDDEGAAAVAFPPLRSPVRGPVRLSVTLDGRVAPLLDHRVTLNQKDWAGAARRRGGWVEGPKVNGLSVRAAAARGVFAVPFTDAILIDAERESVRFDGTVTCECETGRTSTVFPRTGTPLPASWLLRPLEHATSVPIVAKDRDGTTATLDVTLLVIPGALHAERVGNGILVQSPILRGRAYVSVVTGTERVGGGTVVLRGTDQGTASGVLALSVPFTGALWAVVSTEPDMRTASLVGWPIGSGEPGEPQTTFDVPDALLADSVGEKVALEKRRVWRVRLFSALFAASAIVLSAVLVARRAAASKRTLVAHLAASGVDEETTTQVATYAGGAAGLVAVAVLCLALAATLVGVFATLR